MKTKGLTAITAAIFLVLISKRADAAPATAFTYQGRLASGTNAASGIYDLRFTIYDSAANGNAVAGPITNSGTSLSNGLFTVALDFGAVFDGSPRWIEAAARTNGAAAFTVLSPRQAVTATPYAIYAPNAGVAASAGVVSAAGISGTLTLAQLPGTLVTNGQANVRLSGTIAGDGRGLSNLTVVATSVTVPVTRSNVVLSGAAGPLAFINGLYSWSGLAYTNGASGTNAVGVYLDGCWLATNHLGDYLVDTCDGPNPVSIVQDLGGWEDANTAASLPITSSFQGISTILLSVFSGGESNLMLSGPRPIRFVGDGSQLTGTNNMAITSGVTADAFDFATWKSLLKSSFGSYSNWNRFGWQRTSEKIARNQPVTFLFNGLGLMLTPQKLVTGIYPKILQYLPLRGYLNASQTGILALTGGAVSLPGWDTNWFSVYYALTGPTATMTWTLGAAGFSADTFTLAYLAGPASGSFVIQTNNGSGWATVAAINAFNGTRAGRVFSWTSPVPQAIQVRVAGQDNTTNNIIDLSAINSTVTNGVVAGYSLNYSASIFQMQQPGPAILGPIFQAWNPDMILFQAISGTDDVTNFPPLASIYMNYTPNASVVVCGTYPINPASDPAIVQQNSLLLQDCQRYGFSYFDGHTPFIDYAHMVSRGLIWFDGVHATPLGDDTYNDLLLEWLSLFDAAGVSVVTADTWSGLANSNSYVGAFSGNATGLTNITSASLASDPASLAKVSGGRMNVGPSGNIGIGTNNPQAALHVVGSVLFTSGATGASQSVSWSPGDASWNFSSDRNIKERISAVDPEAVLDKLARLPVVEWSYQGFPQRHIGPMAQDFNALFPVSGTDRMLNEADLHGVEISAIQGLNRKMEQENAALQADLRAREAELKALRSDLEKIKESLKQRAEKE